MATMMKVLQMIVAHPDPASVRVLQLLNVAGAIHASVAELKGHGLRYSKFAAGARGSTFPSKLAMLVAYTPSLLLCSAFLLLKLTLPSLHHPLFSQTTPRLLIFAAALASHFLKRVLEVLFLHRYSGSMEASVSFVIASAYSVTCINLLYAQQCSVVLHPPAIDLMGYGVGVFVVGIGGNFYHHSLLAGLRKTPTNNPKLPYMVPQGGLFTWVVCPHYLFESIGFMGLAMIAQTTSAFIAALGVFLSLCARSLSTKDWYLKKIEGFPMQRKAIIPFLL